MTSNVVFLSDIDHLIVKHNSLIEARTDLTEIENKLVSLAIVLTRLHEKDPNRDISIGSTIRIYASDYMKAYSVSEAAAYNSINNALNNLFNRYFNMVSKDGVPTAYHWIESKGTGQKLNDGFVEFTFSQKAIELISGFDAKKGNYTSYGIERIKRLKGSHTGRIYEIIIQYKNRDTTPEGKRETKIFALEDFRELIGIAPDDYREKKNPTQTRLDNFKKVVIDKPLAVINAESDITVEALFHKTGRRITGISFSFEVKKDYVSSLSGKVVGEDDGVLLADEVDEGDNNIRTVGDETKQPKPPKQPKQPKPEVKELKEPEWDKSKPKPLEQRR